MSQEQKLRRRIDKRLGKQYESRLQNVGAFTGNVSGVVNVPGRRGYIYVRDWYGVVHIVFNDVARTERAGYYVRIGYDKYNPTLLRVLGMGNPYVDETYSGIGPHHATHEWPGNDVVWVQSQQIVPGLVIKKAGMTVSVFPFFAKVESGFIHIPYQEIDLTASIPASGACWAVISIRPDGAVDIDATTTAADILTLMSTPIEPVPATYVSIAAVALYAGETEITQNGEQNPIVDLRWFGGSGGAAGDMFKYVYDPNDDGSVVDSDSTRALRGYGIDPAINPTEGQLLRWDDAANLWKAVDGVLVHQEDLSSQVDGAASHFDVPLAFMAGTLEVYENGLRQEITAITADVDGLGFTLDHVPPLGYALDVAYLSGAATVVTPAEVTYVLNGMKVYLSKTFI